MLLIGKERLGSLLGDDRNIDLWISAWVTEMNTAIWKSTAELKNAYPRAKSCSDTVFIFPICESGYSVKTLFSFEKGIALIQEVVSNEK